jgi:hypothetical protein
VIGAVQVVGAHAGIARDAAAGAGIGDLHPPPAVPAAHESLEQATALAGGAAAFPGLNHVAAQPLARLEVLAPGHIAGMVLGNADGPLFDRQLDRAAPHAPVLVELLLLAGAAEHERAGIGRVGQEVVHRAIARADPPDPARADRSARQLLVLGDQLLDDLARRAESPPQLEHAPDRVPDLLVGAGHDQTVLVAVQADRQVLLKPPRLALLRSPPSRRERIRCSSASDIVPFNPSSNGR